MTNLEDYTQFMKCLSDETRLAVVLRLARGGECCVCDLVEGAGVSQPLMSRHLAQLRQCGIVSARREGRWMHYRLNDELPYWSRAILEALIQEGAGQHLASKPAADCAA